MRNPTQMSDDDYERRRAADKHLLRLTAYPAEGPYERWELTAESTGEILLQGKMPVDENAVREAASAYHQRVEEAGGKSDE